MKGLSITAIGMRPIEECIDIFRTLQKPLGLDYLELAIGSPCDLALIPDDISLVLHDRCLHSAGRRLPFSVARFDTWDPYVEATQKRKVIAMSVHPTKVEEASLDAVTDGRIRLEDALGVPVMLEVMPSPAYWCSAEALPLESPSLLLDISHINIWHRGNSDDVRRSVERLLPHTRGIHLSHNNGRKDSHDLIPADIWFADCIEDLSRSLFVTYESLPVKFAQYERLDKRRGRLSAKMA